MQYEPPPVVNMSNFNPYTAWLRIPADQLPADYYRLLGLKRFETERAKIDAAVEMRVGFLQDVSNGVHVNEAQKLLSEVARARLCLLNPAKREKYDAKLRSNLAVEELKRELPEITELPNPDDFLTAAALPEAAVLPTARLTPKTDPLAPLPKSNSAKVTARKKPPVKEKNPLLPVLVVANSLLLIVIGIGIFWFLNRPDETSTANPKGSVQSLQPAERTTPSTNKSMDEVSFEFAQLEPDPFKDGKLPTPLGDFQIGADNLMKSPDEKIVLQLKGGEQQTVQIQIAPSVSLPAELTLGCCKLNRLDQETDDLLFVEVSADGKEWTRIVKQQKSKIIPRIRDGNVTFSPVYFAMTEPDSSWIRITTNAIANPENPNSAGIMVDKISIRPVNSAADLSDVPY